ncbi:MAG: hypothetical protein ABJO27_08825 [Pseudoruegeria sp.]
MNLFERVVSAKGGGRETLSLSETQIESVMGTLFEKQDLLNLINEYQSGVAEPKSLSEEDEISLRQRIFPTIQDELRKIDPRYQIFSPGILERLFEKNGGKGFFS